MYLVLLNVQYFPGSTTAALVRQIWDTTSYEEMTHYLGWTLSNLRIRERRVSRLIGFKDAYRPTERLLPPAADDFRVVRVKAETNRSTVR